ncbi:MAG: sodium:proton antiporter [Calditrichaceae bacterium]|nr:sodium:proton antiporter [Calditrichaceae bacterium]
MVQKRFFLVLLVMIFSLICTPVICQHLDSADTIESVEDYNSAKTHHQVSEHHEVTLGEQLSLWWIIPFAGILLSIALFPLIAPHFWHKHFPKISLVWALAFAIPFYIMHSDHAIHEILHIYFLDYIPFIVLLWGLFTISGGILIKGTLKGTPVVNVMIILIGTVIASWIGTTGAAMVMIRPLLRANENRKYKVHLLVFFIFLVANIGGSLTPLGDPPLFLGFLHGVSFFWTLNLFPEMFVVVVILLGLLYMFDSFYYRKENLPPTDDVEKSPIRIEGSFNFLLLLGVIGGVIFSGTVHMGHFSLFGIHLQIQNILKDVWIILMGLTSIWLTKKETREGNGFNWFPILEVAYLFAGIFMTIIPALAILKAGEKGALAGLVKIVNEPYHYFWVTGTLSSFLDNAPTYLTFFNGALGKLGLTEMQIREAFIAGDIAQKFPEFIKYLTAISIGAVFMGANTYIGNAPNFMVKSIAEEAGIPMPSFFGYMIKYSIPILIPTFIIITFIFF